MNDVVANTIIRTARISLNSLSESISDITARYSYFEMEKNLILSNIERCIRGKDKICTMCRCNESCTKEHYNACNQCKDFSIVLGYREE